MSTLSAEVELPNDKGDAVVSCSTTPGGTSFDVPRALDGARDGMLDSVGATFEGEDAVHIGSLTGRDIRFAVGDQHGRGRVYVGDRHIVTLVLFPTSSFTQDEVTHFFDGMQPTAGGPAKAPKEPAAGRLASRKGSGL